MLAYGLETWVLNNAQYQRLQLIEWKVLRRIYSPIYENEYYGSIIIMRFMNYMKNTTSSSSLMSNVSVLKLSNALSKNLRSFLDFKNC